MTAAPLRIVFFGTPDFALPTLDALLGSRHPVVGVVTQPDRPRGRGQQLRAGPVKARALTAGVTVLQPVSLKDASFIEALTALRADLGVVAAYGKILTETILAIPRLGMINVHASLLPRYRGAAPIHRAVAAGDTVTGVTIMRVVRALDAGAMLASVRRPIGPDDTSEDVERDLATSGAALLVDTVERLAHGPIPEEPQDDSRASYAPRLSKEDGLVDWTQPAGRIHDQIRGMRPWPGAYSYLNGERLILLRSTVDEASQPVGGPGTIMAARGEVLRIATGAGTLLVRELQSEGKRPMGTREFLAGRRFTPGDRFGPP
ncbi:MAG: methionyl-tRNA formyltransferase [Vicinamibacterales bacterium]